MDKTFREGSTLVWKGYTVVLLSWAWINNNNNKTTWDQILVGLPSAHLWLLAFLRQLTIFLVTAFQSYLGDQLTFILNPV